MEVLQVMLSVFSVFFFFILAIVAVFYVFNSLALYTIAKRRGISAPYTAWIPFASTFLLGKIAEQYETAQKGKSKPYRKILLGLEIPTQCSSIILLIFMFASLIPTLTMQSYIDNYELYNYAMSSLSFLMIIMMLFYAVGITYMVFYFIALYKIYHSQSPSTSTLLIVLSILFSFITPFVLFANRNKDEGFIELNQRYAQGQYQQQYGGPYTQAPPNNNATYSQPYGNTQQYTHQQYGQQNYPPQYQPPKYSSYEQNQDHNNGNNN